MTTVHARDHVIEPPHEGLDAAGFGARGTRVALVSGGAGLAALALAAALTLGGEDGARRFLFAYLTAFTFFLSISVGALFFVILQHLTRAGWSVVVRRPAELLAANVVPLGVLALVFVVPTLVGDGSLYLWADHARVEADHVLHSKAGYLNGPFFAARAALYFVVWGLLAMVFLRRSTAQDASGDPALTSRMQRLAAPAMLLFALTVTFAAFDFLMSLDPYWYSTIFGVYFFSGAAVAFFAALALAMMGLQSRGRMRHLFTTEHYHDVGKLLFAFVFFWGYIAFSQFMLIWYANIPEETRWYGERIHGGWMVLAAVLVVGHFLVPFAGLLSRTAKRRKALLGFWAAYLLVMHYVDLYWIAVPASGAREVPFGVADVLCLLGLGGIFVAGFYWLGRKRSLVPVRDPRLGESLAFENV